MGLGILKRRSVVHETRKSRRLELWVMLGIYWLRRLETNQLGSGKTDRYVCRKKKSKRHSAVCKGTYPAPFMPSKIENLRMSRLSQWALFAAFGLFHRADAKKKKRKFIALSARNLPDVLQAHIAEPCGIFDLIFIQKSSRSTGRSKVEPTLNALNKA